MRGIKKLTVYSRQVVAMANSRLDLSAPSQLKQEFKSLVSGYDGEDGKHGVPGAIGRTIRVVYMKKKLLMCYPHLLRWQWFIHSMYKVETKMMIEFVCFS